VLLWLVLAVVALWSLAALTLLAFRWIDPPTTAVRTERRFQAWIGNKPYHARYEFIPLRQISPNLQHAVIAAEDARFYQHHGFDWHAIQLAADNDMEGGRLRGGSTLTQQLVKNLFFGTEPLLSCARARRRAWFPSPNWSLASSASSSSTSTKLNGDPAFTAPTRRRTTITKPRRVISTPTRPLASRRFCPRRGAAVPSA
jgi:hypothetical protein